jgi:hypothetical protein
VHLARFTSARDASLAQLRSTLLAAAPSAKPDAVRAVR